MKIPKLRDLLLSLTVATVVVTPQVQAGGVCVVAPPVSNGCSTHHAEYLSGEVALFRQVFDSACNTHDVCYELLGKTRAACDGDFRAQTKDKCDSINRWFFPGEWYACRSAASAFAAAVELAGEPAYRDAQNLSAAKNQKLAQEIASDQCGSTPERAKIYSVEMISYVNNSFAARLGRAPSIYEQFAAINANNPAGDPFSWRTSVDQYVESHRYLTPPTVSYTYSKVPGKLTLTSVTSAGAANHRWHINGVDTYAPVYSQYVAEAIPVTLPSRWAVS